MGRQVSEQRRSAIRKRGALNLIALAIVALGAGFALYGVAHTAAEDRSNIGPAATTSTAATSGPQTLKITVVGAECRVFVRRPGGDILLNQILDRGRSVFFNEPELNVVLSDSGAVDVLVNGVRRQPGQPGERAEFTVIKNG